MKNSTFTYTILFILTLNFKLLTLNSFAQVPGAFSYQAVVRNNSGEVIANQEVSFKISILQNFESGISIYTETHEVTTNTFGLANLKIGRGTVLSGNFSLINWGATNHFLKVEIDPAGGTGFTQMGAMQLLAVPYAFHAKTVENDEVEDADSDATNELQSLSISGTQLTLSDGGGTVTIPASGSGGDNWGSQVVESNITLSGDGTSSSLLKVENDQLQPTWDNIQNKPDGFNDGVDDVDDADNDPSNELDNTDEQELSIDGNILSITGGNDVELPGSVWIENESDIYYNTGKVGIGTDSPDAQLHVSGDTHTSGRFESFASGGKGISGFSYATSGHSYGGFFQTSSIDGAGVYGIATATSGTVLGGHFQTASADGAGVWGVATATSGPTYGGIFHASSNLGTAVYADGGLYDFYAANADANSFFAGNVGIGTDSPGAKLHVHDGQVKISDGSEGAGKVLTSDANGLASWQDPAPGSSSLWTANGDNIFYTTGNVGINEPGPTSKLCVNGEVDSHAIFVNAQGNGSGIVAWSEQGSAAEFTSSYAYGVRGTSECDQCTAFGGYFVAKSTKGCGVFGSASAKNGDTHGGKFISLSNEGTGIYGSGGKYGIYAEATRTKGEAIAGKFNGDVNEGIGVWAKGKKYNIYAANNNSKSYFAGKVGIGYLFPGCKLHVKQDGTDFQSGLRLERPENTKWWSIQINQNDDLVFDYNGTSTRAWISDDDASYHNASDRRLKQNIHSINSVLQKVMQLNPVTFRFKTATDSERLSYGFIAQNVKKVFPDFVSENNGMLGLAYHNFGTISIKAIQEQQELIISQQQEIEKLSNENKQISARLEALESIVKKLSINQ